MKLGRLQTAQFFKVFQPRWRDRKALLADYKIGVHNEIVFPKAQSLPGTYYISGEKARSFPTEKMKTKNGAMITMRIVPLDALEPLERE